MGEVQNEEVKHAAVAVEFLLCSMYYTNRVFDEKGGEEILSQTNNQVIASMITRELSSKAFQYAYRNVGEENISKFNNLLGEVNYKFYIGEFMDINCNIYKPGQNQNWQDMISAYYKRSYLIDGVFYEKIALIGALLGRGSEAQISNLCNFSKYYAIMMQIINDISDFVPTNDNLGTETKVPVDAYSDIKHQKLTLPILWALINGSNQDKYLLFSVLEKDKIDIETMLKVTISLTSNGAIYFAKDAARQYARKAKEALGSLPA